MPELEPKTRVSSKAAVSSHPGSGHQSAAATSVERLFVPERHRRAERDAHGVHHGFVGFDVAGELHQRQGGMGGGRRRFAKDPCLAPVDHHDVW